MGKKYKSLVNYSDILAADEQGHNLGLDASIFLRQEVTPRSFITPRIGTQGKSTSDAAPSTDISLGTDKNIDISVDGGVVVTADLSPLGALSTGDLIAAALEVAINAALLAAGQSAKVWAEFAGGLYIVSSQSTGLASTVVITDAAADNVADELKLGVPNAGVEVAGINDQDALLYTTGGPTFSQPVESNNHRSGRFHSDVIQGKKVAEFDIDTMVNMKDPAGDSLDAAVRLLLKSVFGTETVFAGTEIRYTQGLPTIFMSLVRISTIFGEYYTGAYVKDLSLAFPGDGPATVKYTGKAQKASIAGIAKLNGAVVASDTIITDPDHAKRFNNQGDNKARVMGVDPDGVTILAGADGSITAETITIATNTIILSEIVDIPDDGFLVPWHPGAVQETKTDNIFTDLQGSFKVNASGSEICVTNIDFGAVNDHQDRDSCFGQDANFGFIAGQRMTMTMAVTFDLSNDNFQDVVQAREFLGFSPVVTLGDPASGRALRISAPNWKPSVPALEVPENGATPTTLEGILYQSVPGAKDPVQFSYI